MNKRQRKKWLKKHNLYVNPKETWELYLTIAEFVLPRLKMFKKETIGYPGYGDVDTFEKWQAVLDEMIQAFTYIIEEDELDMRPEYNYIDEMSYNIVTDIDINGLKHRKIDTTITPIGEEKRKAYLAEVDRRNVVIQDGLELFIKYYRSLWW